jgi:hypothetical protein
MYTLSCLISSPEHGMCNGGKPLRASPTCQWLNVYVRGSVSNLYTVSFQPLERVQFHLRNLN